MDAPYELLKYVVLAAALGLGIVIVIYLGPEGIMKFMENISGIFVRVLARN
jgi:hypothetical protein